MNIKGVIIGLAIIILTIFVTFYGINTVFPKPMYEDYCPSYANPYPTKVTPDVCPSVCVAVYTINKDQCVFDECGSGCGADNVTTFATSEQCEQGLYDFQCYDRLNEASKERARKVFFLALPLGILIIIVGAFAFGLEYVGAGLMGGGVATLIYGSGAYWPYTENWIRFALSLLGLVILIWFAYFFNRKFGKKSRK